MATKLFVGSLAWAVTDEQLRDFFAQAGEVVSATVVKERDNPSRSRGIGFVEMADEAAAKKAVEELNGKELEGRAIHVDFSKPREERPAGA